MGVVLRKRMLGNGQTSLFLDICENGERRYEFLKLYLSPKDRTLNSETLKLAQSIRAKKELEIRSSEHNIVPSFRKQSNFVEYFRTLSSGRHKSWKATAVYLEKFAGERLAINTIDERWLDEFKEFLQQEVSQNTACTYFNKINAALNIAVRDRLLLSNPGTRVNKIKSQPSARTFLIKKELQSLSDSACRDNEVKRAFLFACYTGLRLSDIKNLEWSQISDGRMVFKQKKTGDTEYFPLSTMAQSLLGTAGPKQDKVFTLPKSEQSIWSYIQTWAAMAGIEKHVSFHVARHTFATLAMEATGDIYLVSTLLGHKDIKPTQIYAKIIDENKRKAVNKLPAIEL
jgi:integrase